MANNQLFNEIGDEIKEALKEGLAKGDFSGLNNAIMGSVNRVIDDATDQLERSTGIKTGRVQNVSTHTYSTYSRGTATRERQKQLERERKERQQRLEREREERQKRREAEKEQRRQRQAAFSSRPDATEARRKSLEERRAQNELAKRMKSPNAIVAGGKLLPTKFDSVDDTKSIIYIIFGVIGVMLFFAFTIAAGIVKNFPWVLSFSLLTAASAGLGILGIQKRKITERAKRYARICGEKMYAKLSQISSATGMSEKALKKDIKKMLRTGYYPEGYMDEEETTLMLSEDVYREYSSMKSRMKTEEEEKRKEAESRLTGEEKSELDIMVGEGMDAVNRLHKLNDDIPGEVISAKLDLLEDLLKQIFNRVSEHPEQMDRMHKLMDYYLPTMLKLVEAYAEYDKVSTPGKELIQAKSEIENTLDTINEAFVQLLNNLFQDSVWDVTSDAQVLTTMLTQEGLAQEAALKTQ